MCRIWFHKSPTETPRYLEALGVIADADIFVAPVAGRLGHVFDGIASIARRRVGVEIAADVLDGHPRRQGVSFGARDLIIALAQLRVPRLPESAPYLPR